MSVGGGERGLVSIGGGERGLVSVGGGGGEYRCVGLRVLTAVG